MECRMGVAAGTASARLWRSSGALVVGPLTRLEFVHDARWVHGVANIRRRNAPIPERANGNLKPETHQGQALCSASIGFRRADCTARNRPKVRPTASVMPSATTTASGAAAPRLRRVAASGNRREGRRRSISVSYDSRSDARTAGTSEMMTKDESPPGQCDDAVRAGLRWRPGGTQAGPAKAAGWRRPRSPKARAAEYAEMPTT